MLQTVRSIAFLAATILCVRSAAARDVVCSSSGGEFFTQVQNELVNGEYEIVLRGRGNPGMTITVTATSGTNPIRLIRINTLESATPNQGNVALVVQESGGTISYIRKIEYYDDITPGGYEPGELWVQSVIISGGVGDPGTPHSGYVLADIVSTVDVDGTITGDIFAGPRLFGGTSTVATIRSTQASILGDVFALYGAIDEVSAGEGGSFTGTVGTSTNTVAIWSQSSIKRVIADSIYADIDATRNGGSQDLWYLKTEVGPFVGA